MNRLIILLTFFTTVIYGQTSNTAEGKYDWDYVIKYVRKNEMNATKGTQEIISDIKGNYKAEDQQMEFVKLYREAYDYKIVDKLLLKEIVDSLIVYGISENVKSFATESVKSVEYRLLGKTIKNFEFPNKDGQMIKLINLREKIVIVELWATWCGPCIKEMSKIPELRRQNASIEFYSISVDKSADKMKKFIEKTKYDWPIVFGGDQEMNSELWDYLKIVAIPKYYIVDREGTVINVSDKLDDQYIQSLK